MKRDFHFPNDPDLGRVIRYIFQTDGFPGFKDEIILPKGVTQIIFDLSESQTALAQLGGGSYQVPRCFMTGYTTSPVYLQLPRQQTHFGIQFYPLAIKTLLGMPANEFSNTLVDLTLVEPSLHSLWHRLAEKKTFSERIMVIAEWVRKKNLSFDKREKMLNNFLYHVRMPLTSVPDTAAALCYSPRQLSRKLYDITGMNAEDTLLFKKYLHAMTLVHDSSLSLTAIGHQSHFSDQSHFIRSFKIFTNLTPGEYRELNKDGHVPGHIFQNVR